MIKILEKDIVNYICDNWDKYFKNIKFYAKEKQWLDNWRCDITAYREMIVNFQGNDNYNYRAPIFIEVKFRSSSRDLIYELEKAKKRVNTLTLPSYIGVMSDNFDDIEILTYLLDNKIFLWKINLEGEDIETLTLEKYDISNNYLSIKK